MYSIDDMYTPVMYQDIMNLSMGCMNSGMGMGMYPMMNTNLLNGVQMKSQPMTDKYETIDRKDKECNKNFKSILKVLGWMTLGGLIPVVGKRILDAGGFGKSVTELFKNGWNSIKKIF